MTVDSNSAYCDSDPYWGTIHMVAEAARNIAVTGAKPLAVTNCLNFGNPEEPEVMGQIKEAIRGLSDACKFFETPVTGGNVSLYNQTGERNIKPTPTIGTVGWIDDLSHVVGSGFTRRNARVALLGFPGDEKIYRSEFARTVLHREDLACPPIDLKRERNLQDCLVDLAKMQFLLSAHDCSDGGFAIALIEACLESPIGIGATIQLPEGVHPIPFLFGEYPSRVIISYLPENEESVLHRVRTYDVPMVALGVSGGDVVKVAGQFVVPLGQLREASETFFRSF
jgi:phosphoribosylformylglycinamidine synthase